MADFQPPELPQNDSEDLMGLNKDLERMREDVENISVQLTCMIYDTVVLRTSPELAAAMLKLEAAYRRCRAAMENMERTGHPHPSDYTDLENMLKELDSLANCMDQLALRTHLRQCDLIVCVGHPEKLKIKEALEQQQVPSMTQQ